MLRKYYGAYCREHYSGYQTGRLYRLQEQMFLPVLLQSGYCALSPFFKKLLQPSPSEIDPFFRQRRTSIAAFDYPSPITEFIREHIWDF
jgi:hypothetical protein